MQKEQPTNTEKSQTSSKTGWIAAIVILLVAVGAIIGLIIGTQGELSKKDEEISKLKKDVETAANNQTDKETTNNTDGAHTEPAKSTHSLEGFDTKIESVFKLIGSESYLSFEKMIVSKDGEYMFIKGKEMGLHGGGGLAQYYRSTDENGTWKFYAGGNGMTDCSKFNEEQIEIAKKYAEEIDLIDVCLDGLHTKKITDL